MDTFENSTTVLPTTPIEEGSGVIRWDIILGVGIPLLSCCIGVVGLIFVILNYRDRKRRERREDQRLRQQDDQGSIQQEDLEMLPQPTEGTPHSEQVQAFAQHSKEALKKVYKTTGSYVQMLPWVDDDKLHIMDIYINLCLVEQVDTNIRIPQIEENNMEEPHEEMHFETREDDPVKCEIKSYEEIFKFQTSQEQIPIKRVVISGSAGIGKTTLIDKIAYDWALGRSETLDRYELLFVLKMSSLKQSSDLIGAIFDQLLDKDSVDQSVLKEFIDKNQDKVLILLDGFDEFQTTELDTSSFGSILKVLNRKQGTECWVVITTRPPLDKLVNSSLVEKPYAHVAVEGFSPANIKEYVNKFFHKDHDKASKLIEHIELSDTLSDLASASMLLLLMCLLWKAENTLPDTMTQLFNKALKYIFKRKERNITEDAISKILIAIGKVPLDHLISTDQSFAFKEEDFEKSALDAAMSAGVLTSERVIDGLDNYQRVYFIHHTLLEYCAAMYWQSLIKTDEFNRIQDQIRLTAESTVFVITYSSYKSRYDYLLRFCCGDNEECTNQILQKAHQNKISRLVTICYFESQSKKEPPENVISSVLTDNINITNWKNDRTNAFFHFLKCVADLSRGNDYFTKVVKLCVFYFNYQRFSNDLAKSIKLMTNLQYLSLEESSITQANTEEILLASPLTLAGLVLRGNHTLGGSLSSLAPQLTKLKRLSKLHLVRCPLVAQDVSPIAKSIGATLVDLDVSENRALGGCASIWGPQLGEMKRLQTINLADCSLQGTDIEPIAVARSGMLTLADLNLSGNHALGGCAELWALHLKRMRHLEGVNLSRCSLKHQDVKPIAVALSYIQTLVHLDLTLNLKLGNCASLWALHLKKMNHLKKLILYRCNLSQEDMKPIAESVSSMPTLAYLDLSSNFDYGGSLSLWILLLKQLTKHLKKLKMDGCSFTNEDRKLINAAIGSNLPIFQNQESYIGLLPLT